MNKISVVRLMIPEENLMIVQKMPLDLFFSIPIFTRFKYAQILSNSDVFIVKNACLKDFVDRFEYVTYGEIYFWENVIARDVTSETIRNVFRAIPFKPTHVEIYVEGLDDPDPLNRLYDRLTTKKCFLKFDSNVSLIFELPEDFINDDELLELIVDTEIAGLNRDILFIEDHPMDRSLLKGLLVDLDEKLERFIHVTHHKEVLIKK